MNAGSQSASGLSDSKGLLWWVLSLFLGEIQLLPLILFAPFLIFPEYFPNIVTVFLAGLLILFTVAYGFKMGRRFLSFFILLFPYPLLASVSYWASADKLVAIPKLYLLLTAVSTLVLVGASRRATGPHIADEAPNHQPPTTNHQPPFPRIRFLTWLFVLSLLGLGLMGPFITQFRWTSKFLDLRGLGLTLFQTGEILDINLYGCLMAISTPVVLGLALHYHEAIRQEERSSLRFHLLRIFLFGAFLLFVILLTLSQARAGLVGLAGGLSVFLLLSWRRGWIVVTAGLIGAGIGVWVLGLETIQEFVSQSGSLNSLESRLELWNRSMYAIQDFPFTGIGAGMFNKVIPLLYPLFLIAPDATPFHSHNLYLQVALDLGVGGLVAFVSLISFALICGFRGKRIWLSEIARSSQPSHFSGSHFLMVGYLSALAVFLVNGLLDSPLWMNKPMAVPFFLMAVLIASARASHDEPRITNHQPPTWRFWLDHAILFILWVLISLVAISFVGDHPYWTLAIAIAGGLYLGWEASRSLEKVGSCDDASSNFEE